MQFSIKTLLLVVVVASLFFAVCSPYWKPRPQDREDWNNERDIHSGVALEVITSSDVVTLSEIGPDEEEGYDLVKGHEVISGPFILEQGLAQEISNHLADMGRKEKPQYIILDTYCPLIKLDFKKGTSEISVHVDTLTPKCEVFEQGYTVGFLNNDPTFFKLVKDIERKLKNEKESATNSPD